MKVNILHRKESPSKQILPLWSWCCAGQVFIRCDSMVDVVSKQGHVLRERDILKWSWNELFEMKCRRVSVAYSPHTVADTKGVEPVSKTVDRRLLPGSCGELECALDFEQCRLLRTREKVKSTWCLTAVTLTKEPRCVCVSHGKHGLHNVLYTPFRGFPLLCP